jgi:hypothetical protein
MLYSASYCKKSSKNYAMKFKRNKDLYFANMHLKKLSFGLFLRYKINNLFMHPKKCIRESIMMFGFHVQNVHSFVFTIVFLPCHVRDQSLLMPGRGPEEILRGHQKFLSSEGGVRK